MSDGLLGATEILPYRKLWFAVMETAYRDLYLQGSASGRDRLQYQEQARLWFIATRDGVGSFIWICQVLEVDPGRTRKRILEEEEKGDGGSE